MSIFKTYSVIFFSFVYILRYFN